MKKYIAAALAALMALSLCACDPATQEPAATTTQPTETQPTEAMQTPEEYEKLLSAVVAAFPNVSGLEEYPGMSCMYDGHTSLTELGYAIADLEGDGAPELMLKSLESPFVYDVYTMVDGELTHLLTSDESDSYRLYEEGYVEHQWSGEEGVSGTDYFRVENGSLVLFDRITSDAPHAYSLGLIDSLDDPDTDKCFFRSTSADKADYVSLTMQEAFAAQQAFKEDNFHLLPQFTPLSDYQ